MNLSNCICSVYYNCLSNFFIVISTFLPGFEEDIIQLQYKTIECINEDYVFSYNSRKRKRFHLFVENLVEKNNEFLEKIKLKEFQDNDLMNYDKITDNITDDTDETEDTDATEKNESDCDKVLVQSDNSDLDDEDKSNTEEEETIYENDKKND
jgi:hypothetical protein